MKVCKCGCELPDDYKYKKCDKCRKKTTDHLKKGLVATVGVAGTVLSVVLTVAGKGNNHSKQQ